jgi:hypothetical protein
MWFPEGGLVSDGWTIGKGEVDVILTHPRRAPVTGRRRAIKEATMPRLGACAGARSGSASRRS